jgi:hypothetical protein
MRTFIKTSMIGCLALAVVCMTSALGHTQGTMTPNPPAKTLCAKCGVVTEIAKCQPVDKTTDYPCVSINSYGRMKPLASKPNVTLPYSQPNSASKTAAR